MHRLAAAVLAAGACASSLQAQTSQPFAATATLTLAEALARADATFPGQEAAAAAVRAAEAQRRLAGLRPNPSIIAEAENVAGTGIYKGLRSVEASLGLSLPLELGGKRGARIAVADAQIDRARLGAAIARADLRLQVTRAYIDAAAAQRRTAVARENLAIAAEALRAARVRVQAGRASPLEEQRAELARIASEGAAERANLAAAVATAKLARLVGGTTDPVDLAWFEGVGDTGPETPAAPENVLAAAAARADLAGATAQTRLARSQRIPDVTLSAGARRLEQTGDVAAIFGVSVPLPFFDTGRAGMDLAAAERDRVDAQRRVVLLEIAQAIASAQAEAASAAISARSASGPALAAAQEAARIARIGYREGKFGQLELLDAERTLSDTRLAAIDALAAYHDARARLERLTTRAPSERDDDR